MNNSEKLSLLDKSIILAIFPILGYFLMYLYEIGYLKVFNIPVEFINMNMSTFINIIPQIYIKILIIIMIWIIISSMIYIEDLEDPIKFKAYTIGCIIACFFIISIFSYNVKSKMIVTLIVLIILCLVYFLPPIINKPKIKGYRNKFIAQKDESDEKDIKTLIYYHVNNVGYKNIKTIFLFVFLSTIIFQAGTAEAMLKTNYYKLNDNVVIRIYNDVIICCEYDSKSKKIDDSSFKVLQKDNIDNLKFEKIVLNSKASEIKK